MAKLTAPLMSFGASGKLGGSLVYGSWKGIPTARQFIIPANPRTAGQIAQRNIMALIVALWRAPALKAVVRAAWDRLASSKTAAVSGFNVFTSNLVKLFASLPTASVVVDAVWAEPDQAVLTLVNIADGSEATEAGNFGVVWGVSPSQMVNQLDVGLTGGELTLTFDPPPANGESVFFAVRKAGAGAEVFDRSGIIELVNPA